MKIEPIANGKGRSPFDRFSTVDLEWYPETLELRLVGVYDGRDYRAYTSIEHFLRRELSGRNRTFFAHYGGMADIVFFLRPLADDGWSVEAIFSGSSAIIVTVKRDGKTHTFIDSFWTLRGSLRSLGAAIGINKLDCAFDAPIAELTEYNYYDCLILFKALCMYRDEMEAAGVSPGYTLASTAMKLFRTVYLEDEIRIPRSLNDELRHHYIGGRVEVFNRKPGLSGGYFDINSSYPYSMTKPLPGSYLRCDRNMSECCFIDGTFRVKDCREGALPVKYKAGLAYPTGLIRGVFYIAEVMQGLSANTLEIEKIAGVYHFEPQTYMRKYALEFYGRRRETTDPFKRLLYKLLMNSLYGKFGEKRVKEQILINPITLDGESVKREIRSGIVAVEREVNVPHENLAIAGAITAQSRATLYSYIAGSGLYYCDTDSAAVPSHVNYGDSSELGAMKKEFSFDYGHFVLPKLYRVDKVVKAKGFPRADITGFEHIVSGGKFRHERFRRVRGVLKTGLAPFSDHGVKQMRDPALKRYYFPDGDSRPYTVDEAQSALGVMT